MNDVPPISTPRILHIITRLDRGGSTTNTLTSVKLQRNHQFETALAYGLTQPPPEKLITTLRSQGIACYFIPKLVRNPAPLKDLAALADLLRLMKRERFDLVHTHTSKAGVLGRIAAARLGLPVVHTAHGHIFYGYFSPILTRIFVLLERLMARRTARLISLTDTETRESLERRIGAPNQYVTIPSGVPLAKFQSIDPAMGLDFRSRMAIPYNATLITSIGRLTAIKGFDLLLAAFAKIKTQSTPVFLAVLGDGEEKQKLHHLAASLGIHKRVIFTGDLNDIRPALAASDIFALSSRNEGMGRVIVEAMAAGLPVVATAVGGVPEVVQHGSNGLLVPLGDADAMAEALANLADNPTRSKDMGLHAAKWVYPRFDENTMLHSLAILYRNVLNERNGHPGKGS